MGYNTTYILLTFLFTLAVVFYWLSSSKFKNEIKVSETPKPKRESK